MERSTSGAKKAYIGLKYTNCTSNYSIDGQGEYPHAYIKTHDLGGLAVSV